MAASGAVFQQPVKDALINPFKFLNLGFSMSCHAVIISLCRGITTAGRSWIKGLLRVKYPATAAILRRFNWKSHPVYYFLVFYESK
jgi:hypothetical protein